MNSIFLSIFVIGIILLPFILMITLLMFYRRRGKAPASVMGHVSDLTTPFLFLAIYVMVLQLFEISIGLYIATGAVIIGLIYAVIEKRREADFRIIRFFRKVWRFFFLLLAIAYVVLFIVGIVLNVIEYV